MNSVHNRRCTACKWPRLRRDGSQVPCCDGPGACTRSDPTSSLLRVPRLESIFPERQVSPGWTRCFKPSNSRIDCPQVCAGTTPFRHPSEWLPTQIPILWSDALCWVLPWLCDPPWEGECILFSVHLQPELVHLTDLAFSTLTLLSKRIPIVSFLTAYSSIARLPVFLSQR